VALPSATKAAPIAATDGAAYAEHLTNLQRAWWKRVLPVQAPYHAFLRRQRLGATIDVGCGAGRLLEALAPGSVGVDHNEVLVGACRARGLHVTTADRFVVSVAPHSFDSLLCAHVLEHLDHESGVSLLRTYGRFVRAGGKAVLVTPQERGQRSDPTHVRLVDFDAAAALCEAAGLHVERQRSYPFPRAFGRLFVYNEFVTIARVP